MGKRMASDREARQAGESPRTSDARLQLLIKVIGEVQSARTVDDLMGMIRSAARRLSGADGVSIVLRDGDQCHYADEDAIAPLWKGQRFPLISCISGWVMQNRQTTVVPDVYADPRVPHDVYRPTFVKSLVMVPVGNDEATAAIGVYWSRVRTAEPEEIATLETLARAAGTALRNIDLLASLSDAVARAERELSERERAEADLAAAHQRTVDVLESMPDAFYTVDQDWRLLFVNRRAKELWRRRREELIGARLWDLFPDVDVEATEGYRLHMQAAHERRPLHAEFHSVVFDTWVSVSIFPCQVGLSVYFRDIGQRKRVEQERELLLRELSHRVKNVLAVVQSLALQTDGRKRSVEEFRDAFVGRLQALARTHGLLLDAHWRSTGTELKTLVEQAVAAYRADHPKKVEIEGEPVALTPKQALGLSLVLHELSTNAAKYGALSQSEGRLLISWDVEDDGQGRRVRIKWQERDGPRVEPPGETGFGAQLIERACGYELQGEVELDFAPRGLTAEILFPPA
jgi:PAS domain S-box-containing protein